jgi:hypothetical protein
MEECKVFRPCFQKATEFAASYETAAVCHERHDVTLAPLCYAQVCIGAIQEGSRLIPYFLGFRRLIGEKTPDEIIEILTLLKENWGIFYPMCMTARNFLE